jgi:hypothetical protein
MSATLAGLISAQLSTIDPVASANPAILASQQQLATAIATAVQLYLQTAVTVVPGQTVTTTGTAVAQTGATTTPGTLLAQ